MFCLDLLSDPSNFSPSSNHYDVIVIGAGLSGLAASLRSSMFGKKVLLLEKHYIVGGLNSFYAKGGKKFDVGLHALTNFPSTYSGKSSPLLKLCRQLRIPLDSLLLQEQSHSRITFGKTHLCFDNNFEYFLSEIEKVFPKEKDRFHDFLNKMEAFPAYSMKAKELSGRKILADHINDPLLREMLLCPTCYYGSAQENDIDFPTFIMLFDAIFKQGLARPEKGIRSILDPVRKKLHELGVVRKMNSAVSKIKTQKDRVSEIEMETGECYTADQFISTCGGVETENLLGLPEDQKETEQGRFTIIESISVFDGHPLDFGWEETVVFFNQSESFCYNEPKKLVDLNSGVICLPENYGNNRKSIINESKLRITHPANFDLWNQLDENEYIENKKNCETQILENGLQYLKDGSSVKKEFQSRVILNDTFTPKTIKRFTSHEKGTLYGSPTKKRDGSTRFRNLFLAGTDQGYVGIVGAMLGGIAVANNQILRRN